MPVEWSSSPPELLLSIDRASGERLSAQLERQLREAIRNRRLHVGERLPSSREIAAALGLSRGLVQECYAQLRAEGYIVTRPGSATRVAAGASTPAAPAHQAPTTPPRLIADFRWGVPDLSAFPIHDWLWATREAARAMPTAMLDYGDPHGSTMLREVLAGYLRRVRSAAAEKDRIIVCNGYAQGLGLALRVLADKGVREVAFEDPGAATTVRAAAAAAGLTAVPVPVDEHGIDVQALAATQARAAVVTPAHQWPTGVVLAPQRRLALIEWAVQRGGYIIEDEYDAEFRYDREPIGSLQGLSTDHVISISTVSKSLAPALRIGWMLCPPHLVESIAAHKHLSDRGTPTLDQLALARLIESGRFDRHLRRVRTIYAQRRTALVTALGTHAPQVTLTGLAAGFHAVALLPDGVDEQHLLTAARERAVGLYGISACQTSPRTTPAQLILGFGNVSTQAINSGITAIADLLR